MSTLNKLRHDKSTPRPTYSLPPLRKLNSNSVESSLRDLKQIFFPRLELKLEQNQKAMRFSPLDTRFMKNRRNDRHDAAIIVPDSGYASAEEEEEEEDLDQIRADTREREF